MTRWRHNPNYSREGLAFDSSKSIASQPSTCKLSQLKWINICESFSLLNHQINQNLWRFLANFGIDVVENLPKGIETGIYYGFASVDNGEVYKMVMSIGWNPYYDNEHKSMVSESLGDGVEINVT
jgi:hypothetical protein